jgi:hypothetical protein
VTVAHCDLPLLHGYLPYRPSRGTCEIRSSSPNLWFMVAGALGFRVTSLRCHSPHFADMVFLFCPQAALLVATPRRCNTLPDVIFSDVLSLPWGDLYHWEQWATPHVFFVSAGDTNLEEWGGRIPFRSNPHLPSGWTACSVTLTHCEGGGRQQDVGRLWLGTRRAIRPLRRRLLLPSLGSQSRRLSTIGRQPRRSRSLRSLRIYFLPLRWFARGAHRVHVALHQGASSINGACSRL